MISFTRTASAVCRSALILTAGALSVTAGAQVTFDFETSTFDTSARVGGDKFYFKTTQTVVRSGSSSLHFANPGPEPYENFTYDMPFDSFTSGIVQVWFYDARGAYNTGHGMPQAGGSIILEDADNPQDFVAMEVLSFPYGKGGEPAYYATEGIVDRLTQNDRFDSSNLAHRTIGFHKVEFHVTPTDTRIFVDNTTSLEVAGPGSSSRLRLRIMADSPSNNGNAAGWLISPRAQSAMQTDEWLYFDDISFLRELPSVVTHTHGFEIESGSPTYDSAGNPGSPGGPGSPPNDNPFMDGFVNQWAITTSATAVRSGSQAAYFSNAVPPLKSVTFDLADVNPGTSATLYFYDALGQDIGFDKSNSIIIENADDPAEFLAVEISNWPYPYGAAPKTYYVTEGAPGEPAGASFWSRSLPVRSMGWHKVEFGFYEDHTLVCVDNNMGHRNDPALLTKGPGTDKALRLRLMADGASQTGSSSWTAVDPLTASYHVSAAPFVYYDDITLPVADAASVSNWALY